MEENQELTPKEKIWADSYLLTLNKAESARRAKYKGDSAQLACIGWQNYRKLHIKAYLRDKLSQMAMPPEEVIRRLSDMASSSIADFAHIRDSEDLANEKELGHLIKKFKRKITRFDDDPNRIYEEVELELYDAQSALEKVGRHLNLFADRLEVSGPNKGPIEFREIVVELPPDDSMES